MAAAGWRAIFSLIAAASALVCGWVAVRLPELMATAMERIGHMAGIASSVRDFASITTGAVLGVVISQAYDARRRRPLPASCWPGWRRSRWSP